MSLSNQSEESSTPATPSAGRQIIYPKAVGWFTKNAAGVEEQISGASKNTRPCFRAVNSGTQAIGAAAVTIANLATEVFDTNANFASNVFTPTIAGKYLISASLTASASSAGQVIGYIYKNGASYQLKYDMGVASTLGTLNFSAIVDMNGTTDYVDLRIWCAIASTLQTASLEGCRVD